MSWYKLEVGIEHLSTGICFHGEKSGFQFEMVSPSVFAVWSDAPFSAYWPTRECHIDACEIQGGPSMMRCSATVADFAANRVAQAIRDTWTIKDNEGNPLPQVIVDALIRKFGATPIPTITRGYPYYWFQYAGMFHGIEPDGYIHT